MTQAKILSDLGDGYSVQGGENDIWVVRPDGTPAGVGHKNTANHLRRATHPTFLSQALRSCKLNDQAARS